MLATATLWFKKLVLYLIAHLPFRILASVILYLALFSLSLHLFSAYLQQHPQQVKKYIHQILPVQLDFDHIQIDYNLVSPILTMKSVKLASRQQQQQQWLSFDSVKIRLNLLQSLVFLRPHIDYIHLDGFYSQIYRNKNQEIFLGNQQNLNLGQWLGLSASAPTLLNNTGNANGSESSDETARFYFKKIILSNIRLLISDEKLSLHQYPIRQMNLIYENHKLWQHKISLTINNQMPEAEDQTVAHPFHFQSLRLLVEYRGDIYQSEKGNGRFYLDIRQLQTKLPSQLLKQRGIHDIEQIQAKINTRSWGSFSENRLSRLITSVDIEQAQVQHQQHKPSIHLHRSGFIVHLQSQHRFLQSSRHNNPYIKRWDFKIYHLDLKHQADTQQLISLQIPYIHFSMIAGINRRIISLYTESLPIRELSALSHYFPEQLRQAYHNIQPRGMLNQLKLYLVLDNRKLQRYQLQSRFHQLSMRSWQYLPQLHNISGQLWLDEQSGRLQLDSENSVLGFKPLFRNNWKLKKLEADISWQKLQQQWWVHAAPLLLATNHGQIRSSAQLWFNSQSEDISPYLLLQANMKQADIGQKSRYLPVSIMDEELVQWLDQAVVGGKIQEGGIVFRGRVMQFPFARHQGTMDIVVNARGVLLDYMPGWPKIRDIQGLAQFTHRGMKIDIHHGRILEHTHSNQAQIKLEDYFKDSVQIRAQLSSNSADARKFLQSSQLVAPETYPYLGLEGPLDLHVTLDLGDDRQPLQSEIVIKLENNQYQLPWLKTHRLKQLQGDVTIKNGLVSAKKIAAVVNGRPLTFSLRQNTAEHLRVQSKLLLDIPLLKKISFIHPQYYPLLNRLQGSTPVDALVEVTGKTQPQYQLNIHSNMKNIGINLPAPLNKPPQQQRLLNINYFSDEKIQRLQIEQDKTLSLCYQDGHVRSLNIKLQNDETCRFPDNSMIQISGNLDLSQLQQWQKILKEMKHLNKQQTGSQPSAMDWSVPIQFDLQKLLLPANIISLIETEQESQEQKNTPQRPVFFRSINGKIEQVFLGNENFGKFQILSRNEMNAIKFDRLLFENELIQMDLHGRTGKLTEKPMTELKGSVHISNLGRLLNQLGLYDKLERTQGVFTGYIKWHGNLSHFSKDRLFGKINFELQQGALSEIEPGIGRLIGLFNLKNLQQKFALDINNSQSEKGFSFSHIRGNLLFNQNNLYTRDIELESDIANININGRIMLNEKKCDHHIEIIPDISSGLPYAGLVIAGPTGAAIGWFGQKVLGHEINKISRYNYRLSGACNDPQIEDVLQTENTQLTQ